jgi:hypothetical protein
MPEVPFLNSFDFDRCILTPFFLHELVGVAKEFGFEGIVAKRKDSFYESGKRTGSLAIAPPLL